MPLLVLTPVESCPSSRVTISASWTPNGDQPLSSEEIHSLRIQPRPTSIRPPHHQSQPLALFPLPLPIHCTLLREQVTWERQTIQPCQCSYKATSKSPWKMEFKVKFIWCKHFLKSVHRRGLHESAWKMHMMKRQYMDFKKILHQSKRSLILFAMNFVKCLFLEVRAHSTVC